MLENETENTTAESTEQTEQVEEIQKTQEVKTEQVETEQTKTEQVKVEKTELESKDSFVKRWGDKIRDRLSGSEDDDEEGNIIPDEFVEAARKMNWSDEDTMKFAGDFTDEQLKEMIPSLLGEDSTKADETSDKTDEIKSETKEDEVEDSQDGEALKAALDRITVLEEKQGVSETESKETEKANFNQRASDLFDEASKEFEVFGKTKDLPTFPHNGQIIPTSPQMKARLEVYGMAEQLKEAGMPGDKALEFSLNAFKGAHLKVETQRNVIKDLKKREQTLGGKRVSHEATEAANLTGPQVLQEVARKHGVELPP